MLVATEALREGLRLKKPLFKRGQTSEKLVGQAEASF